MTAQTPVHEPARGTGTGSSFARKCRSTDVVAGDPSGALGDADEDAPHVLDVGLRLHPARQLPAGPARRRAGSDRGGATS